MKKLKLYRGLSSDEFHLASDDVFKANRAAWAAILEKRVKGDRRYPSDLDRAITTLHRNIRLEHQYFTDDREIAEGYARKVGGLLVELEVPVKDVLEIFDIEFQNFGRRKKKFEVVYCVRGSELVRNAKRWKLKVGKKK